MTGPPDQNKPKEPKPSRTEEAQRIISEYANDLREIVQKLRRKMN
jgi:hypothetical protein